MSENKVLRRSQQRLKSDSYGTSTKIKAKKIALSSDDIKRMQKTDCKKSIRICNDAKKRTKRLKNGKCGANINNNDQWWWYNKKKKSKVHNPSWPKFSDNPFRILFVGGRD